MTATKNKLPSDLRTFKKQAQAIIDRIARDRDELRDLISDYSDILESCDDAARDFESGIESLSRLL